MSKFIDFEALKAEIPIEKAISMLGLSMQEKAGQFRGPCPACKRGGDRALSITPAKQRFFCFGGSEANGDVISLVAHIKGIPVKDAAQWLHDSLHSSPTVPRAEEGKPNQTKKLEALSHLESDHEAVVAVGLDLTVAARLGIGYRTKGAGQGSVLIPVRNDQGDIEGYLGVQELTYVPKDFQPSNVVALKKPA